jgi:4,5-dihydroxyphthalate decarboxylase
MVAQDDDSMIAIPVFPSRMFRLSAVYVRTDGPVKKPEDLAGKRVGVVAWTQTATVYARGWLSDYIGVDLKTIDWVQAGDDYADRPEAVDLNLPDGLSLTQVRDRTLSEMMLAGDLDATIIAVPPIAMQQGSSDITRLLPDARATEEKYWADTGIFPIMHAIVIRREIMNAYPWVARNLFKAFVEAKNRSLGRALYGTRFPIPMCHYEARKARERFGDDFWPYGIEPNRATLEAFLKFSFEQGACRRHLTPEDLFAEQPQSLLSLGLKGFEADASL